jgi:hypothetical protein
MIYLRLSGGLGNQLYQITAMSLLSQCKGMPVTAFIEGLSGYTSPREADALKIVDRNTWLYVATPEESSVRRWATVTARAGRTIPVFGVNDRSFWWHVRSGKRRWTLYADGYFQRGWGRNEFERALGELSIRLVNPDAANRLVKNEVAVHIRGGDFLRNARFQVVGRPFYTEAVKRCLALGFENFAVITDDQGYAATVFRDVQGRCPRSNFRILEPGATTLDDFDTLRSASARIIGNSTFAWWATALGAADALTWSPSKFTLDQRRDFFLPNERQVTDVSNDYRC